MTLCLHTGATTVSYDDLREVETPQGTVIHVPVAHHEIVSSWYDSERTFNHRRFA